MHKLKSAQKTKNAYSFLWTRSPVAAPSSWHFDLMQEAVPEKIVRGRLGLEIGCGAGYDLYLMANSHPQVKFVSIDISDGIYRAGELTAGLKNAALIKSSALNIPLKDGIFDFVYSFGVLHHTEDPKKGLREAGRLLKQGGAVFLYLYEDHSDNILKYISLKAVFLIRCITLKLPNKAVYLLSAVFSPVMFMIFTLPAKAFCRFKATRALAAHMPFNFAEGPFSLTGDLYDRFSAPIEYRFNRRKIDELFDGCGFSSWQTTRLNGIAGWVAWGYKK